MCHRVHGLIGAIDEEAGRAVADEFRQGAERGRDDRRPGRERLDDRQPEGLLEGDEVEQGGGAPEQSVALGWSHSADEVNVRAVDEWLDLLAEVGRVLDDACDDEGYACAPGHLDRKVGPLFRMDSAQEQQVTAIAAGKGERIQVDAVVDRRVVREGGVSVGVADRHVVRDVVVRRVDGDDPLGGEPVDRRDHRRRCQAAVREWQEVKLVGDDVEVAGTLEDRGDVQRLVNLHVDVRSLLVARGRLGVQLRGRRRVGRGEEGHLMASCDQALSEGRGDLLPGTIRARGHAVSDRGENGDPNGGLRTWVGENVEWTQPSATGRMAV